MAVRRPKLPPDHLSYLEYGIDCRNRTIRLIGPVDADIVRTLAMGLGVLQSISNDAATVFITSEGGDEDYGYAALHLIQDSPLHITTVATGDCSSAAIDIWMGGDRRLIMPMTRVMMHIGEVAATGTPDTLANSGRFHIRRRQLMTQFYAARTGKPQATFALMLTGSDHLLLPDEAIEKGLAHGYYPEELNE